MYTQDMNMDRLTAMLTNRSNSYLRDDSIDEKKYFGGSGRCYSQWASNSYHSYIACFTNNVCDLL